MSVKSDKTGKSDQDKSYVSVRIVNFVLKYITTFNLSRVIWPYCSWINQKAFINSL